MTSHICSGLQIISSGDHYPYLAQYSRGNAVVETSNSPLRGSQLKPYATESPASTTGPHFGHTTLSFSRKTLKRLVHLFLIAVPPEKRSQIKTYCMSAIRLDHTTYRVTRTCRMCLGVRTATRKCQRSVVRTHQRQAISPSSYVICFARQ